MHQIRTWTYSFFIALVFTVSSVYADAVRERVQLDSRWKFHLGHATDTDKDFSHGTQYFTYLAKTGFGDGPAAPGFDDRGWREVRIPHDWAVEMPFDGNASHSHGYRAVGPRFPENSVGWYRHTFQVPEADLGRRISLQFDGIQRAARIFVNGFFLGEEIQGNVSQHYDITPYLNYGGDNIIAVRADVSIEEGWYYEGAGLLRPVYLHKTNPVHVDLYGTFVRTEVSGNYAEVLVDTAIVDDRENSATETLAAIKLLRTHSILNAEGDVVATAKARKFETVAGSQLDFNDRITLKNPALWSPEMPNLYTLVTRIETHKGELLDEYKTPFGVRTIRFDPNEGFFLNNQHVKLKGSNNHEDHAGVGSATPDSLIEYRMRLLKEIGMNAYRASHAPAAPAVMEIADRIGMFVINENRIMGVNAYHMNALEHMIKRDRNHPSVIMWSLGNEEWWIESNIKGARITKAMQSRAKQLDPTRPYTVAISGGWGGISTEVEVMGVNYIRHGDTDKQHAEYPWQIILGTEETTTQQTRGIYYENKERAHLSPQKDGSSGGNAESGWQHYAARPYLAGIFYWTGFDYRGEPTPYGYPAISSQFGILDTCGFPKDGAYYLKAWWQDEPVLHIARHWNWAGREGEKMPVVVHSNAEEVELFLNGKTLGRKVMPRNDHLQWQVKYAPGELRAQAYNKGKPGLVRVVATTASASGVTLDAHVNKLTAGSSEVAVINVSVRDSEGLVVPTSDNNIRFDISGPANIIGVGNGNPSSHEDDVQVEALRSVNLGDWKAPDAADAKNTIVFETKFNLPVLNERETLQKLMLNALGEKQTITLNGKILMKDAPASDAKTEIALANLNLKKSGNVLRIEASPFADWGDRSNLANIHPAKLLVRQAPKPYARKVFNGWAQVIVQAGGEPGTVRLKAQGDGLQTAEIQLFVESKNSPL
jgi:Beta-galactosidase/beta-glucuronidase